MCSPMVNSTMVSAVVLGPLRTLLVSLRARVAMAAAGTAWGCSAASGGDEPGEEARTVVLWRPARGGKDKTSGRKINLPYLKPMRRLPDEPGQSYCTCGPAAPCVCIQITWTCGRLQERCGTGAAPAASCPLACKVRAVPVQPQQRHLHRLKVQLLLAHSHARLQQTHLQGAHGSRHQPMQHICWPSHLHAHKALTPQRGAGARPYIQHPFRHMRCLSCAGLQAEATQHLAPRRTATRGSAPATPACPAGWGLGRYRPPPPGLRRAPPRGPPPAAPPPSTAPWPAGGRADRSGTVTVGQVK